MKQRQRFVVFEQDRDETSRVGDVFGIFYSWERANKLCSKLHSSHPEKWYGIRELLHGSNWLKD